MTGQSFTIKDAFKDGWELTKANIGFLIGYQLILYVFTFLLSFGEGYLWVPIHIIAWFLVILGKIGFYNSAFLIVDGVKPTFKELYQNYPLFISWLISNIIFAFLFTIGLILFIVPGFYVLARYGFYLFFLVGKKLGPIQSLEQASIASEGQRMQIFLLFLACIGLNIIGLLLFVVGLLVTVPVTLIALATVYKKLTKEATAPDVILITPEVTKTPNNE